MTKKPRITITLEPHSYEVLSRLSAARGQSMSQLVVGFLEIGIPSLERLVALLEQAKAAEGETSQGLKDALAKAESTLLPAIAESVKQNDLFISSLEAAVHETADLGRSTPVLVIRGSGSDKSRRKG